MIRKSKSDGFTLVELVIVIAIVIVLSVVSSPIYRSYVDKAIGTEAVALLGTLLTAQKVYYTEYGNFYFQMTTTSYDPNLGIDARGNKYFTVYTISGNNSGWTVICNGTGQAAGFSATIID